MVLDKFRLDGKVALVTGAGSGLGQAMAIALAEAGAGVAVVGRRKALVEETAQEIARKGRKAFAAGADVSKSAEVKSAVEKIEEALGPIDVLVNAAGIINDEPTLDLSDEAWRVVIDVNLTGTFIASRTVGAGMVVRGSGSIINIATFLGDRAHRMARAAYNASKAGVVALSRALSVEWGQYGVRVNCISPGAHRTPMSSAALSNPEAEEWLKGKTVLGRVGETEDIQGVCVFLASDASSYITGVNIYEDGGGWV